MANIDRLKEIMRDYSLSRQQVADLCKVKRRTVDGWLYANQNVSDVYIELLELKLK